MKVKYLLGSVAIVATMASCSQEEINDYAVNDFVLKATVDNPTFESRAGFDQQAKFYWSQKDKLGVTTDKSPSSFAALTLQGEGGSASGAFKGSIIGDIEGYAVYPHNRNHKVNAGELSYYFPAEYNGYKSVDEGFFHDADKQGQANSFNFAMWGKINEGTVSMKHLGGVFMIQFTSIPSEGTFVLSADQKLNGTYSVDLTADAPEITVTDAGNASEKQVIIPFSGATEGQKGVFYVPAPTGTYTNVVASILNKDGEYEQDVPCGTVNIKRANGTILSFVEGNISGQEVWDGKLKTEPGLSADATTYYVSKASHWAWIAAQTELTKNVKLTADIDFAGNKVTTVYPAATEITFDGNGKTIKNLVCDFVEGRSHYSLGMFGFESASTPIKTFTIRNLNLDNVKADNADADYGFAALLIGDTQNGVTVNIEGVKVTNSTVKGVQSVGTLVGFLGSGVVNVKNTTVEGNTLTNYEVKDESGYVCGLVGKVVGTLNVASDVTVKNNTIDALYAIKRGAKSINAVAAVRENGVINGNATVESNTIKTTPMVEADLLIYTKEQLLDFATNFKNYNGKVVALANDIDLAGDAWNPIGDCGTVKASFCGTFDGCGNTIKNLTIEEKDGVLNAEGVGFFAWLGVEGDTQGTVKNLNFDKVNVKGHHNVAVVVGYLQYGSIENCKVTNSEVTCNYLNEDRGGDKAGTVVGFVNAGTVKECSAENSEVNAVRDAGQVVGCAKSDAVIGCSAKSTSVIGIGGHDKSYQNINNSVIGRTL